jgi:RHS repeat-associated protein
MHQHSRQNTTLNGLSNGYKALLATPHRFTFNGKEKDDEFKGEGNSVDFGSRIYDPRTGKFLSIDPRWKEFPANSPFCYAANNPVRLVDVEGEGPGDPIFSFGFKSDFSFKATTSLGIFASVSWKQSQALINSISMESGARGELNFYSKKWGNGGIGVDGSAQAFFGVSVGPNMTPAYRGFVNSGHQFSGSGIGSNSSSGTIGWNQTFQFGSNVSGENINQRIGGPYLRVDWKSGSLLVSHLNDMWGDGRDGYDGANGHATYTNFGTHTWQTGYSFQIVTPQPNVIDGIRETTSDNMYYVTSNSNVNYFQESSLNFQMQTNSGFIGGGLTSRGNWTQGFWQNHVAHKDGNKYPMFKNSGSSGFKPSFKLNYTSPLLKK